MSFDKIATITIISYQVFMLTLEISESCIGCLALNKHTL